MQPQNLGGVTCVRKGLPLLEFKCNEQNYRRLRSPNPKRVLKDTQYPHMALWHYQNVLKLCWATWKHMGFVYLVSHTHETLIILWLDVANGFLRRPPPSHMDQIPHVWWRELGVWDKKRLALLLAVLHISYVILSKLQFISQLVSLPMIDG